MPDATMPPAVTPDHEARLNRMEGTVDTLVQTTAKLESSVNTLMTTVSDLHSAVKADRAQARANHEEVRQDIRALGEKYAQSKQTNWPVLFGAGAFFLSIVSIVGGVIAFAIFTPNQITERYQEEQMARDRAVLSEVIRAERETAVKAGRHEEFIDLVKAGLIRLPQGQAPDAASKAP